MRTLSVGHVLALVCSVGLVGGCASTSKSSKPKWFTFGKKKEEEPGPKIVTPREKMEQLRNLSDEARKLSPELQDRASMELAQGIAHERDPVLRAQVLRTLGNLPSDKGDAVLAAGLHDHDRDVRIAACEALGKRGGPQAAQELSRALSEDADVDVRLAATRGLGESRSTEAIHALGDALEDQDPAIQHRAIASMKKVSGKDFGTDLDAWRQYAKTGQEPPKPTLAQRLRKLF
jgi:HEAT repeat protein